MRRWSWRTRRSGRTSTRSRWGRAVSPRLRVAFEVDDARSVAAELVAAGAQEIAPPRPTPFGSVNARLDAPAGLQITVFQPTGGGSRSSAADLPGGDSVGTRGPDPAGGDVEIRDAVAEDWSAIWPFFREIVAAGETYAWPRDMAEDAARRPGSRRRADRGRPRGQRQGSAAPSCSRTSRDPARTSRTRASWSTRRTAVAASGAPWPSTCWPPPRPGYRAMQFNAVVATNTRAVALWRSLGFAVVGTVPDAFDHPAHGPVDLLVMHRRL